MFGKTHKKQTRLNNIAYSWILHMHSIQEYIRFLFALFSYVCRMHFFFQFTVATIHFYFCSNHSFFFILCLVYSIYASTIHTVSSISPVQYLSKANIINVWLFQTKTTTLNEKRKKDEKRMKRNRDRTEFTSFVLQLYRGNR